MRTGEFAMLVGRRPSDAAAGPTMPLGVVVVAMSSSLDRSKAGAGRVSERTSQISIQKIGTPYQHTFPKYMYEASKPKRVEYFWTRSIDRRPTPHPRAEGAISREAAVTT